MKASTMTYLYVSCFASKYFLRAFFLWDGFIYIYIHDLWKEYSYVDKNNFPI